MFCAKALYNNVADTPDELSFNQGDVLEVLEQNASGWWLCSLKSKIGIVPGNRLRVLTAAANSRGASPSGRNSPSVGPSGQKISSGIALPSGCQNSPSSDQGVAKNWHLRNKVVVPKKLGNVYVYDSPNRVLQDYDVPPARRGVINSKGDVQSIISRNSNLDSEADQNYDVPSALRSPVQVSSLPFGTLDNCGKHQGFTKSIIQTDTDTPPRMYDIPANSSAPGFEVLDPEIASNRSSILSMLSTGSHSSACSGHSSRSGSHSARSSIDISLQDIYDVPSLSRMLCTLEANRQSQTHTEMGMLANSVEATKTGMKSYQLATVASPYVKKELGRTTSTGPPSTLKLFVDRDSYLDDYSIPRSDISQGSGDSGISISNSDSFSSRSCTEDIYDTPRKLCSAEVLSIHHDGVTEKPEELTYDVPTQISISANSSFSNADLELSLTEVVDRYSGIQTSNSATETLVSLQSNVLCHTAKLVGFINRLHTDGSCSELELSQVKLACLALKAALKEVLDFENGLLAHFLDSTDKSLSEKFFQLMEKVRVQLQFFNRHVEKLITTQWPLNRMEKVVGEISELDDTLNTIGILAERISGHLQALTKFILQNLMSIISHSLVERGGVGLKNSEVNRMSMDTTKCRPPLPPSIKSKPNIGQDLTEKQLLLQDRPLPPLPTESLDVLNPRISKQSSSMVNEGAEQVQTPSPESQTNDSDEWNDDCDYVSIANEVEREMKSHEKSINQQSRKNFTTISENDMNDANIAGEIASPSLPLEKKSGGLSLLFKERLQALQQSSGGGDPDFSSITVNSDDINSLSVVNKDEAIIPPCDPNSTKEESGNSSYSGYQLVNFYSEQVDVHFGVVNSAVRDFFQMLSNGDSMTAKEFVLRSKFVILAAHKLVYIGDTITRNSANISAWNQIATSANNLCDILKEAVAVTKMSALQFPQNANQQKITECMKSVLQGSLQLYNAIRSNTAHSYD